MNHVIHRSKIFALAIALAVLLALPATAAEGPLAAVTLASDSLYFSPQVEYGSLVLTVSGGGEVQRFEFAAGEPVSLSLAGLADDSYTWELVASPSRSELSARVLANRELGEAAPSEPAKPTRVQTGYFTIQNGALLDPELDEPSFGGIDGGLTPVGGTSSDLRNIVAADVFHNDDVIVTGSLCVGFDCVNGENFGFDTIRLKENNLRIKFEDTSNSSSFPSNDWQITANDSTNGGANKFSIDDIDGGRTPFTIEASAPSNSLYVDDGGRLGLGTSTPVVDLQVVSGNTPTLRLEQNGSSGFTPQTWDVAGNETNFFIRDVTNGSKLPFRIRPGAPTSSIDIQTDGDVGIGTQNPGTFSDTGQNARVHITTSNTGDGGVLIENTNGTGAGRTMMELKNKGNTFFDLNNTDGTTWRLRSANPADGNTFIIDDRADAAAQIELELDQTGNLTVSGTVNGSSSITVKDHLEAISSTDILAGVMNLPILKWSYKQDTPAIRHLGPIAEDFSAMFGLGKDEKTIALTDMAGVALAAIQGLNQVVEQKDAVIDDLQTRVAELEALVQMLVETQK